MSRDTAIPSLVATASLSRPASGTHFSYWLRSNLCVCILHLAHGLQPAPICCPAVLCFPGDR
jgi:hypothetical protein